MEALKKGSAAYFNYLVEAGGYKARYLHSVDLSDREFNGFDFSGCDLRRANLSNSTFWNCSFAVADLEGAQAKGVVLFERCIFDSATLRPMLLDPKSVFKECRFLGTKVDIYTLAVLKDNGLRGAELMHVILDDAVTNLRLAYGGFNRFFHGSALVFFLAPYAWFLVYSYAISEAPGLDDPTSLTIFGGLINFIVSGGRHYDEWAPSVGAIFLFVAISAYSALRASLFWKTRAIEHRSELIQGTWFGYPAFHRKLKTLSLLRWVYFPIIALHVLLFLMRRIPLH